jgi:hypothetical protein
MDRNIREAIELVLEVKLEDGEDLSNLRTLPASKKLELQTRKWLLNIPRPEPSAVR